MVSMASVHLAPATLVSFGTVADALLRSGYTNFFASVSDYGEAIGDAPQSWALIPAVRHAMAAHPKAAYFFHLSPHALIMNPTTSLKSHLLDRSRLESLMLKDFPIVPPDSIIKTFALKEKEVDLIITQDGEDLSPSSFILKNGDFAPFFLDLWFDPLFRSYKFAKAETHGLVRFSSSEVIELAHSSDHSFYFSGPYYAMAPYSAGSDRSSASADFKCV